MNSNLKARAEHYKSTPVSLHAAAEKGTKPGQTPATATVLNCRCATDRVVVTLSRPIYHNHLCGCSRCWRPAGALFAQTGIISSDALAVTANPQKLTIVDEAQPIRRHACTACGAHLFGDVLDINHHFYGLCFVHPELATSGSCGAPEFAGFVSSLVESGTSPSLMEAIRRKLTALAIPAYDAFSPEIMDLIAWHRRKIAKHPQQTR